MIFQCLVILKSPLLRNQLLMELCCIIISNCFAFKPRLDLDACLYLPRLLESVFVEIALPNIIIGAIYRHLFMSLKSFNSKYLKPFLHQLSSENKQLILLGDFNVSLLKVQDDPESSTFLDALGSNLLLPQILLPTWIAGDPHTLIDNIFSNASNSNITGNICFSISDHLPQFCIFDSQIKSKGRDVVYKQD